MATTSYGTPMVSNVMPNPTGTSTAPSTITITSPMVMPVMPVTPRVSSRAPLPMTQTQTSTITSTPTVSTVMPNPVVPTQTVSTPITTTATTGPLVNRNMGLPLSSARPIEVTETTSNLEEIQNFPVIGRLADGAHFHQDPVSGQVYRMTEEFHQRIPEILRNRSVSSTTDDGILRTDVSTNNTSLNRDTIDIQTNNGTKTFDLIELYEEFMVKIKTSNELVSQFKNAMVSNETQKKYSRNRQTELDIFTINNLYYYNDNVDAISNDIIIYEDGTYEIVGRTTSQIDIFRINGNTNRYNSTINLINNNQLIDVVSSNYDMYYTPVNSFVVSLSYQELLNNISYFTPINRFYNR